MYDFYRARNTHLPKPSRTMPRTQAAPSPVVVVAAVASRAPPAATEPSPSDEAENSGLRFYLIVQGLRCTGVARNQAALALAELYLDSRQL
ncbi:MAG: hypothetical protein P4L61_02960 [Candidatus Pacebacteria bacterium]|nr:hypothetical protein [Candidatus Paceibacterota bacterium]